MESMIAKIAQTKNIVKNQVLPYHQNLRKKVTFKTTLESFKTQFVYNTLRFIQLALLLLLAYKCYLNLCNLFSVTCCYSLCISITLLILYNNLSVFTLNGITVLRKLHSDDFIKTNFLFNFNLKQNFYKSCVTFSYFWPS